MLAFVVRTFDNILLQMWTAPGILPKEGYMSDGGNAGSERSSLSHEE